MDPDGVTPYAGTDIIFAEDTVDTWDFTLSFEYKRPGWSVNIRLKCSNGYEDVISDAFTYTQDRDKTINCVGSLDLADPV